MRSRRFVPLTLNKLSLCFLHLQSERYACLSTNVIREVCMYIGFSQLLPGVDGDLLVIYDTEEGEISSRSLPAELKIGATFCILNWREALCICGYMGFSSPVYRVGMLRSDIHTAKSTTLPRSLPGVVEFQGHVYAFGGFINSSACEKYDKHTDTWTRLGDMLLPKLSFMPCVYNAEIYLPAINAYNSSIEVFNPLRNTYREFTCRVSPQNEDSIVWVVRDRVILILAEKVARINANNLTGPVELFGFEGCPKSRTSIVWMNQFIWWVNLSGNLMKFDPLLLDFIDKS